MALPKINSDKATRNMPLRFIAIAIIVILSIIYPTFIYNVLEHGRDWGGRELNNSENSTGRESSPKSLTKKPSLFHNQSLVRQGEIIFLEGQNHRYNPNFLVVSHKRKIAMTFFPKVMCSTIRFAMCVTLDGCDTRTKPGGERCCEARKNHKLRANKTLYLQEQNYTTALLLRDPFERALSAYYNSDTNVHIWTKNCKNFKVCTFEKWVDEILDQNDAGNLNEHFKLQSDLAQLGEIKYSHILRMSSKRDLLFLFQNLLGLEGVPEKKNSSTNSKNSTATMLQPVLPDESIMNKLAKFYENDLELWQWGLDNGTPRKEGEELTMYDYWMKNKTI